MKFELNEETARSGTSNRTNTGIIMCGSTISISTKIYCICFGIFFVILGFLTKFGLTAINSECSLELEARVVSTSVGYVTLEYIYEGRTYNISTARSENSTYYIGKKVPIHIEPNKPSNIVVGDNKAIDIVFIVLCFTGGGFILVGLLAKRSNHEEKITYI